MKEYTVNINWDEESQMWYSNSDDVPANTEARSFDVLIEKLKNLVPEMLRETGRGIQTGQTVPIRFVCDSVQESYHCYG